jgi:hypothetical protein
MRQSATLARRVVWLLLLALPIAAPGLQAQYFGRNKVQYQSFDFKVLKTKHFDVYFYPSERPAALAAARMAERWYQRFAAVFDHQLTGRQPLLLYASAAQFQQTNAIGGDWARAPAESPRRCADASSFRLAELWAISTT